MPKNNMGIRDIAKLAGVSVATVSRVINTPELATPATREKVRAIIREHHYIPNLTARNLYAKESNSFALFVYDLENPFFIALVKELHKIAFRDKRTFLICDTENNEEKEREYFRYCEGIRTKGVIFTEGEDNPIFHMETNQRIAIMDRSHSPKHSCVRSDNRAGMFTLVDYLYNLNHRTFGFAGLNDEMFSCSDRRDAFVEALRERGIEIPEENFFRGGMNPYTGVHAVDYFCTLKNRPTAIVCANDQVAQGVVMRANQMGVKIPEDFSVVGFDGCIPDYFTPKITTVRQNIPEIAANLYDCIFGEDSLPAEHVVDVRLEIGDSCARAVPRV